MANKATVLYRTILRQHRLKLPAEMRALGDRYVKDEFRQHRSANAEFLPRFFGEWEKYATHLQQKAGNADGYGKPAGDTVFSGLVQPACGTCWSCCGREVLPIVHCVGVSKRTGTQHNP